MNFAFKIDDISTFVKICEFKSYIYNIRIAILCLTVVKKLL